MSGNITKFKAYLSELELDEKLIATRITHEEEIKNTGNTNKFVITKVNGEITKVRLPKLVQGVPWGTVSGTINTPIVAGLPNITGVFPGVGQAFGSGTHELALSGAFSRYNTTNQPPGGARVVNDERSKG